MTITNAKYLAIDVVSLTFAVSRFRDARSNAYDIPMNNARQIINRLLRYVPLEHHEIADPVEGIIETDLDYLCFSYLCDANKALATGEQRGFCRALSSLDAVIVKYGILKQHNSGASAARVI